MLPVSLFNVARYLTDSLWGPLLQTLRRARVARFMLLVIWKTPFGIPCSKPYGEREARVWWVGRVGWLGRVRRVGWVGRMDGYQKCPLIFSILRYVKHYTHIYLYTKKNSPDKYLVGLYFGQVRELPQRFSKSHFYADFFQKWFPTPPW